MRHARAAGRPAYGLLMDAPAAVWYPLSSTHTMSLASAAARHGRSQVQDRQRTPGQGHRPGEPQAAFAAREAGGAPPVRSRVAVIGGGCSGLQYKMDLVDGPANRDIMVESASVRVVIDPKSALFVSGSLLDYSDDLQKGGFKVTNPNAVCPLLVRRELLGVSHESVPDFFALLGEPQAAVPGCGSAYAKLSPPPEASPSIRTSSRVPAPATMAPFALLNQAQQALREPERPGSNIFSHSNTRVH